MQDRDMQVIADKSPREAIYYIPHKHGNANSSLLGDSYDAFRQNFFYIVS